jgi:flagellar protein FlaF
MSVSHHVVKAYGQAARLRSQREQDAEIFRRAADRLRKAEQPIDVTRALIDNQTLWRTVIGLVNDPSNPLPEALRAQIASVGHTVLRVLDHTVPDIDFVISVNLAIAEGLSGRA